MQACAMTGVNFHIASPKGYMIDPAVLKKAQTYAKTSGATIMVTEDPGGRGERCRRIIHRHVDQHGAGSGSGSTAQSIRGLSGQ